MLFYFLFLISHLKQLLFSNTFKMLFYFLFLISHLKFLSFPHHCVQTLMHELFLDSNSIIQITQCMVSL